MPIADEAGGVRLVINTFQDVTQLKGTEHRLRLLADAGAVIGRSVDYQEALQELADLLVGSISDWCVVDVLEPGQPATRVAVAHADPAKRGLAEEIQRRYPTDPESPGGVHDVIRTGVPTVVTEVSEDASAGGRARRRALPPAAAGGHRLGNHRPAASTGRGLRRADPGRLLGPAPVHRGRPAPDRGARPTRGDGVDNARLLHEANEAVRLRDDFLAMASHDMRTPLAVILANLQLARRRLVGQDGEHGEVFKNLDAAERTTQKLTGLVGELMDISILRSGQSLPLNREAVDLAAVAESTADEYRRLSAEYEITTRLEEGVVGDWDAIRIERVLRNLLDNALKYSPDGGSVEVVVRSDDGWAVAEVTDHGVGIPEDELPLLFEKFHRGSNTRDLRGTGLGLAGSRAVVEQLGGTIDVRSRLGAGSTFAVRLPRDTAPGA